MKKKKAVPRGKVWGMATPPPPLAPPMLCGMKVSLTCGHEEERSLRFTSLITADYLVGIFFDQHDGDEGFPRACAKSDYCVIIYGRIEQV